MSAARGLSALAQPSGGALVTREQALGRAREGNPGSCTASERGFFSPGTAPVGTRAPAERGLSQKRGAAGTGGGGRPHRLPHPSPLHREGN